MYKMYITKESEWAFIPLGFITYDYLKAIGYPWIAFCFRVDDMAC